jgi:tRNA(fMet)-specific endonuclease VapC
MRYLLDTNVCIRFINGRSPKLRDKFLIMTDQEIVVSAVTKAEMFYGSAKSQMPEISRTKQERFLSRFVSLPFDDKAADMYGSMRAELERIATPIGSYDMMIASLALAHDLILITHNVKEFGRVNRLRIEDWEA